MQFKQFKAFAFKFAFALTNNFNMNILQKIF